MKRMTSPLSPRTALAFVVLIALAGLGWMAWATAGSNQGGSGSGAERTGEAEGQLSGDGVSQLAKSTERGPSGARAAARERFDDEVSGAHSAQGGRALQMIGSVVDVDGIPVGGAKVTASTRPSRIPLGFEMDGYEAVNVSQATTDEAGRIRIPMEGSGSRLVPDEPLHTLIRASGYAPARSSAASMSYEPPHDIGIVTLAQGASVSGHITGPGGLPVKGAQVLFGQSNPRGVLVVRYPSRGLALPLSDETGGYSCDELQTGAFHLLVIAEGFCLGYFEGEAQLDRPLIGFDLRLERGLPLAGHVQDFPAGAVRFVEARTTGRSVATPAASRPRFMAIDADGSFGGENFVPEAEYELRVVLARGESRRRQVSAEVDPVKTVGGTVDAALVWKAKSTLSGRVVTVGEEGVLQPVENFIIARVDGAPKGTTFDARTLLRDGETLRQHDGGRFEFVGLGGRNGQMRKATLRIRAVGFEELIVRGFELVGGQSKDLGDLVLAPGGQLNVVVRSEASEEPIAGAQVYLATASGQRGLARLHSRRTRAWTTNVARYGETNDDGVAHLQPPSGEGPYLVAVSAAGHVPSVEIKVAELESDLHVVLRRGASVIAEVVDRDGAPVEGAVLEFYCDKRRIHGRQRISAQTDATGRAQFDAVPPGKAWISLVLPRMSPRRPVHWGETRVSFDVPEAGEVHARLESIPSSPVDGIVTESGAAVADARISFEAREGDDTLRPDGDVTGLMTITGADGRFQLPNVPHGSYEVSVTHRTRSMVSRFPIDVSPSTPDLVLALPEAELEGIVVDRKTGEPIGGVTVVVSGKRGVDRAFVGERIFSERGGGDLVSRNRTIQPGSVLTSKDGTFRLRGLAIDTPLELKLSGDLMLEQTIVLEPFGIGEIRRDHELRVRAAGTLRVRFETQQIGRPRPTKAYLVALDRNGNPKGRIRDQTGRAWTRFRSIAPGRYRVSTRETRGARAVIATEDIEIKPGAELTVTMRGH